MSDTAITRENVVDITCNYMQREQNLYKNFLSDESRQLGQALLQSVGSTGRLLEDSEQVKLTGCIDQTNCYASVFWYSVLYHASKNASIYDEWGNYIINHHKNYSYYTEYFLYWQLMREKFVNAANLDTLKNKKLHYDWLISIIESFHKNIKFNYKRIPLALRNHKRVVVVTDQQLTPLHAPSAIALDNCRDLINAGFDITLLNTAECMSQHGRIPIANIVSPNYVHQWGRGGNLEFEGIKIPYIQLSLDMPNIIEIKQVLSFIHEQKPIVILYLGDSGVTAHLLEKIAPVACFSLSASLPMANTSFLIRVGEMTEYDKAFLKHQRGTDRNVIIKSRYFSLPPQNEHITRQELGIPNDAFVLSIVGNRLDDELTGTFLEMLDSSILDNMMILFIGNFSYSAKVDKYIRIKEHSKYLGHCADLMSRLELCDLFVNPDRSGGGTSGAMALFKGKPVVTVDRGDIADVCGADFHVKDYDEMSNMIRRYAEDKDFYIHKSKIAKEKGISLTKNKDSFLSVVHEAIHRCHILGW